MNIDSWRFVYQAGKVVSINRFVVDFKLRGNIMRFHFIGQVIDLNTNAINFTTKETHILNNRCNM